MTECTKIFGNQLCQYEISFHCFKDHLYLLHCDNKYIYISYKIAVSGECLKDLST